MAETLLADCGESRAPAHTSRARGRHAGRSPTTLPALPLGQTTRDSGRRYETPSRLAVARGRAASQLLLQIERAWLALEPALVVSARDAKVARVATSRASAGSDNRLGRELAHHCPRLQLIGK